jgi:hypothetical protein
MSHDLAGTTLAVGILLDPRFPQGWHDRRTRKCNAIRGKGLAVAILPGDGSAAAWGEGEARERTAESGWSRVAPRSRRARQARVAKRASVLHPPVPAIL